MNVLIKNNNIAHIVKEHVAICILEKSIQETTSVFQYFLVNRAFAVREFV